MYYITTLVYLALTARYRIYQYILCEDVHMFIPSKEIAIYMQKISPTSYLKNTYMYLSRIILLIRPMFKFVYHCFQ